MQLIHVITNKNIEMKKRALIIVAIIGICNLCSAQKYLPNPALDKFVGTWIFNKDGKTIEITLKKVTYNLINLTTDKIEGYYTYKINDKIVENTQKRQHVSLRDGTNLSNSDIKNTNEITLSLFDSIKRKTGTLILIFKSGNPNELQWSLRNREGTIAVREGQPKFDKTFTLPTGMMLTKKEN